MHINSHNFVEIEDILTKFVNEIYNEWLSINWYFFSFVCVIDTAWNKLFAVFYGIYLLTDWLTCVLENINISETSVVIHLRFRCNIHIFGSAYGVVLYHINTNQHSGCPLCLQLLSLPRYVKYRSSFEVIMDNLVKEGEKIYICVTNEWI